MENMSGYEPCWYSELCTDDCKEDKCIKYICLKYQMDNCGLPEAKQKAIKMALINIEDAKAYNRISDIRKNIIDFVNDGRNLYICGHNTGTGKTSWAIRLLHTYLSHMAGSSHGQLRGMFVSVPDLLVRLKDFTDPVALKKLIEQLKEVDLVIWDDIAVTGVTRYEYLQMYNIINWRILSEKANIFTGNMVTHKELSTAIGERLTSRIWNVSEVVEFVGKDIR